MRISDWSSDVCSSDLVGELPLGHAAFLGIGAYTSAILSVQFHVPFWLALPVAGVIAALFGLVIGAITLRLEGHYFVLITLSFTEVMRLIVLNWVEVTRGPLGFSTVPAPVINLGAGHVYARSEEHTSELQSLMRISYAVFCLKKNNTT